MSVAIEEYKALPATLKFYVNTIEDKVATLKEGRWMGKDIDMVEITPPYSDGKSNVKFKIQSWKDGLEKDAASGRIPPEWVERYEAEYKAWTEGKELPLEGTPIKGWSVISPAKQEELIRIKVLTVESLSKINDEGLKRLGMGSLDLKNSAVAWLEQSKKGKNTLEITKLKKENSVLKGSITSLKKKYEKLELAIANDSKDEAASISSDELGLGD